MTEPLYCTHCGAEDFACDCEDPMDGDEYCDVCGADLINDGCDCDDRLEANVPHGSDY